MKDMRNEYRILLESLRINIRMNIMEIGWKDVYWLHVAQDRDQ
jgi:hypothetical protein